VSLVNVVNMQFTGILRCCMARQLMFCIANGLFRNEPRQDTGCYWRTITSFRLY